MQKEDTDLADQISFNNDVNYLLHHASVDTFDSFVDLTQYPDEQENEEDLPSDDNDEAFDTPTSKAGIHEDIMATMCFFTEIENDFVDLQPLEEPDIKPGATIHELIDRIYAKPTEQNTRNAGTPTSVPTFTPKYMKNQINEIYSYYTPKDQEKSVTSTYVPGTSDEDQNLKQEVIKTTSSEFTLYEHENIMRSESHDMSLKYHQFQNKFDQSLSITTPTRKTTIDFYTDRMSKLKLHEHDDPIDIESFQFASLEEMTLQYFDVMATYLGTAENKQPCGSYAAIKYANNGMFEGRLHSGKSLPIMIDNGCTVPILTKHYYDKHPELQKCLHLPAPKNSIVKTGSGQIKPTAIIVLPFKIQSVHLQINALICDSKIERVGLYLGRAALDQMQCVQDYSNQILHFKDTSVPLLNSKPIKLKPGESRNIQLHMQIASNKHDKATKFQGQAVAFANPFKSMAPYYPVGISVQDSRTIMKIENRTDKEVNIPQNTVIAYLDSRSKGEYIPKYYAKLPVNMHTPQENMIYDMMDLTYDNDQRMPMLKPETIKGILTDPPVQNEIQKKATHLASRDATQKHAETLIKENVTPIKPEHENEPLDP